MCPHPPFSSSMISITAALPSRSVTSQVCQSRCSLPPGLSFGPVAVRTAFPATSKLMHVLGDLPPPMRKFRYFRSILNSGEVSVPVLVSPPLKLFTSPFPR